VKKNIQRRLTAARNRAYGADAVFSGLVKDYEESAKVAEAVAEEALGVVAAHNLVRLDAEAHADEARDKARKIREVFGV
jgi:molybdopterin synthase catalytic subunit